MKYINENFVQSINNSKEYKEAIEILKSEVDTFSSDFHDDPSVNSEWGHYYFCDDDGGKLIFDINKPHTHKCEVCGKEFENPIYDGVWVYNYRNIAVVTMWKAACVYKYTGEKKYLDILMNLMSFYATNYTKFQLHNKERLTFDRYEDMKWGCGRILPQGLNESIIFIRMVQALEIVKEDLPKDFLDLVYTNMFRESFNLLKPQVNEIHNIRCWMNSAIGVIGLFFNDKEMIDFAFEGEYNIRKQIQKGVTSDFFWYEGSIHYNFFTLEGITSLMLFSEIYGYDFGDAEKEKIRQMFISAYNYAFDNQYFPNPNDGWPTINLKTYSYIYHVATKIFGEDSEVGNLLKNIENNKLPRTKLPLSKPVYVNNEIAFERLLLNTDINLDNYTVVKPEVKNFPESNFAILRNENLNAFIKYGMNAKSHSHPDLINVELMHQDDIISRDLSNAGYRARLCNEWHRVSLAHNTVVRNGENIPSYAPGQTISYDAQNIVCKAPNTYEGVDYTRSVSLTTDGFVDKFVVEAKEEAIFDYVFHFEDEIKFLNNHVVEDASLGFNENGYQHVSNVKRVVTSADEIVFDAVLNNKSITIKVDSSGNKEVYLLKTLDNPVNKERTTILVREKGTVIEYNMSMEIKEKEIQNYFVGSEIELLPVSEGVSRKVVAYNENIMMCEVHFVTGAVAAMHNHPHEQATYVVSGKFEFNIGGEIKVVSAGDSMYKHPNVMHGATCLEAGMLLDVFTPCRKDFL